MFEILFSINYQLCKEFTGLSPFDVDNQPFVEVIKIYGEVRTLQIRSSADGENPKTNKVIRKKAGDDWF